MGTEVTITLMINDLTDGKYDEVMRTIESQLTAVPEIESVHIGVGGEV